MKSAARFIVGIDLGTTNCAVAFVDSTSDDGIKPFAIAQVIGPGEIERRSTLPSFLFLPGPHDVPAGALSVPWRSEPGYAVGTFARDRGAGLPHRLVASAKSWLCNPEVDLTADILPCRPTGAAAGDPVLDDAGERVSPVQAAARYLEHICAAWNAEYPDAPLSEQDIYLTVPASFDAVAAELTLRAARDAGLDRVILLEEPQAAFYAWLAAAGDAWRDQLAPGDVVLVCDVGGGTTDFSLIEATDDGGALALERVAVGDHILLGGDNMDLALAHLVGTRLTNAGKKLSNKQRASLQHACRRAKEVLLSPDSSGATPETVPVTILGGGSKLIGGSINTELTRADMEQIVIGGFLPEVGLHAVPTERRRMGLGELGLDYAADAAVTKHLAQFLSRHKRQPTAILFNGGVMQSSVLRDRVARIVAGWYDAVDITSLAGTDLNLAVAHGGAYYGLVRRGQGIRIRGGTARSYYVGIETAAPAIPGFVPPVNAMCVVPFGLEEGSSVDLPREALALVVGEPAEFRFFASSSRGTDVPGDIVSVDAGIIELAPVRTMLAPTETVAEGQRIPVVLSAHVTEVGTLELWCVARDGEGRWKLEYSVRDAT